MFKTNSQNVIPTSENDKSFTLLPDYQTRTISPQVQPEGENYGDETMKKYFYSYQTIPAVNTHSNYQPLLQSSSTECSDMKSYGSESPVHSEKSADKESNSDSNSKTSEHAKSKQMKKKQQDGAKKGGKSTSSKKGKKQRRIWGTEDDNLLRKLGTQYKNDWKKISKRILTLREIKRTPTFLKNRFKSLLEPTIKDKFSHEEDLCLADCIHRLGLNWSEIAKSFPGRGAMNIKNRYYSHIRKNNLLQSLLEEFNKGSENQAQKAQPIQKTQHIQQTQPTQISSYVESQESPSSPRDDSLEGKLMDFSPYEKINSDPFEQDDELHFRVTPALQNAEDPYSMIDYKDFMYRAPAYNFYPNLGYNMGYNRQPLAQGFGFNFQNPIFYN